MYQNLNSKIQKEILLSRGYSLKFKLTKSELKLLYNMIKDSILKSVKKYNPNFYEKIKEIDLKDYHKYSQKLDQINICSKKNRTLELKQIKIIKNLKFFCSNSLFIRIM